MIHEPLYNTVSEYVEAAKGKETCPACGTRDWRVHGHLCSVKSAMQVLDLYARIDDLETELANYEQWETEVLDRLTRLEGDYKELRGLADHLAKLKTS